MTERIAKSNPEPQESEWRKVKSNDPAKTSDNYLPVITSNRHEILQEELKNESYVINDDQVIHTEDVSLQTKRYNHGKTIRTDKAKSRDAGTTGAAGASAPTPFVFLTFWVQCGCRLWVQRMQKRFN